MCLQAGVGAGRQVEGQALDGLFYFPAVLKCLFEAGAILYALLGAGGDGDVRLPLGFLFKADEGDELGGDVVVSSEVARDKSIAGAYGLLGADGGVEDGDARFFEQFLGFAEEHGARVCRGE